MSTPNVARPLAVRLGDGRLHLQHGPIDLVIEAFGTPHEVEAAYAQAFARFGDVLTGLVAELPALRRPVGRIHWANSETATVSHAMVDGAIRSGERAAAEVMSD